MGDGLLLFGSRLFYDMIRYPGHGLCQGRGVGWQILAARALYEHWYRKYCRRRKQIFINQTAKNLPNLRNLTTDGPRNCRKNTISYNNKPEHNAPSLTVTTTLKGLIACHIALLLGSGKIATAILPSQYGRLHCGLSVDCRSCPWGGTGCQGERFRPE